MQIGIGLGVRSPRAPSLVSRVLSVSPAGTLPLPGLGSITAGGLPALLCTGDVVLPANASVTVIKNSTWTIL